MAVETGGGAGGDGFQKVMGTVEFCGGEGVF